MQDRLFRKGLVLGLIVLLIGMSGFPSTGTIIINKVDNKEDCDITSFDDIDWWPMFHHDIHHSGYSTSTAPDSCHVKWSYKTDNPIDASPIVVDGKVYIGIWGGDDSLYCLDASDGSVIWTYDIGIMHWSAPAVADGKVFIAVGSRVSCLDASDGSEIWVHKANDVTWSSPVIVDNKIYFGGQGDSHDDNKFYCLDANDGSVLWTYTNYDKVSDWSSPAVVDGRVYVCSDEIYCLDADDGAKIWEYDVSDGGVSSPAVADGKLYFGTDDGKVCCLNASDGSEIWIYQTGSWWYVPFVVSSPAVAYGKVYIGSSDDKLYCLDADDGTKIWAYKTGGSVWSSPAVADEKVYVGSGDGKVYCLSANTGNKIWDYQTRDWLGFPSGVYSSPAIADGKVYIGSINHKLYCFGEPPPNAPTITGPTSGNAGSSYTYTFTSTDPDGDDVSYYIDWGDGTTSGWTAFQASGTPYNESHTWSKLWIYTIKAKAKNTWGNESKWSSLTVTMPRNRAINGLFLRFLEQFPILQTLLQRLGLQ